MTSKKCFDNVVVGDLVSPLTKGPLTTIHLMRWSSALENWHRIHYDRRFTQEHERLPDLMINGSLKQQFVIELLKGWAGCDGWVWKAKFSFRNMNVVGETLTVWARVTETEMHETYGLVKLETGILNDQKVESTPGVAIVALPRQGFPPVPYPFVPPTNSIITL